MYFGMTFRSKFHISYVQYTSNLHPIIIQCEAPKIAKLVYGSHFTMVYGTYNYSYWGLKTNKHHWGGRAQCMFDPNHQGAGRFGHQDLAEELKPLLSLEVPDMLRRRVALPETQNS